jgi:hypothetical protein
MQWKRVFWGVLAVFILLLMLAPLASYCLGREEEYDDKASQARPASTEPSPDASTALQPRVIGPLIAYVKAGAWTPGPRPWAIVMYDLGAGRIAWMRGVNQEVLTADLAGDRVIVADQTHVHIIAADGSYTDLIYERTDQTSSIQDVGSSSDGTHVVVTERWQGVCPAATTGPVYCPGGGSILLIDIATRNIVQRFDTGGEEWRPYRSWPHWPVWRDDGSGALIAGDTGSERPSGLATVYLDGRVHVHAVRDYSDIAPNGRMVAHDVGSLGCLSVSSRRLVLLDLDSGLEVASVQDENLAYSFGEWSPDSTEYLIAVRPFDAAKAEGPDCGYWLTAPSWLLLNAMTGKVEPVPDREALFKRWYGDRLVEMQDCSAWDGPMQASQWQTYSVACYDANLRPKEGSLLVGGKQIDRGHSFTILGFIH